MKNLKIFTHRSYTRWIGVATIMALAVPSWSIPTTSDEISSETSQLVSVAKELTGLYSDAKDAYDVGTKLLQAIGWIKTDPTVSQQITDLESQDNQSFAGVIWTVDSITVQQMLGHLQTAVDDLTTGTPLNGDPDYWSAYAVNYFADAYNYPDASHSTNGIFYRQWTDADQTLLNLLNQNTGGMYSKADFDPQSTTAPNLVYDWRMGVPALMTGIAMRLQIVAALDPNFRTDGKYKVEFQRYHDALQWHYNMMLKGIKCGPYSDICADVRTGIQFPTRDLGNIGLTIGSSADGRYAVQAAMPLYEVKAMIDLMYIYANSVSTDLTENYHRLVSAQSPYYCAEGRTSTTTGVNGLFPVLNACTPSSGQQWVYNRQTGQISNSGTLALPGSGGCLAAGNSFTLAIAACNSDRLQQWTFDPEKGTIVNANGTYLRTDTSVYSPPPNYVSGYAMLTSPPPDSCLCNADSQKWQTETSVAGAAAFTNALGSGASIGKGQILTSKTNDFEAVMGSDGDLSFYHKVSQFPNPQRFDLIWDSQTGGKGVTGMSMQTDGNLTMGGTAAPCVKYSPTGCNPGPSLPAQATVWSSGTAGNPGASLELQDDGNLTIHSGSTILWENGYRVLTVTVYALDVENATFVTQSLPATMLPGLHYNVSITMLNTSNHAWTTAGGYRLASQSPADNLTWGVRRADLPGPVAPGASVTFNFQVIAPQTPGAWPFQWQMIREGASTFGTPSALVEMPVVNPVTDDSRFVIQSLPVTMGTGQIYNVSIRMHNSGLSAWTTGNGYKLLPQRPQGNSLWGISSVDLPATLTSVAPNGEVIFSFQVIAPATPGSYLFEWRMAHNNLGFGDFSPAVTINVVK